MRIVLEFEEDDIAPCLCKTGPLLALFPGATLAVDPAYAGRMLLESLRRANVPVEVRALPFKDLT